jgi:phosphatidyl-myo-inositol dimannoside synthase
VVSREWDPSLTRSGQAVPRPTTHAPPPIISKMAKTTPILITLDYPPERGGVARYLGEFVKASGDIVEVVVEQDHELKGPGHVVKREFIRKAWPTWWPLVGVCKEFGRQAPYLIVSHVLPVGTAAWIARFMGGAPYAVICHGLDVRLAFAYPRRRWLFRRVCRGAKLVVANSESTARDLRALVPGLHILILTPGVSARHTVTREVARMRLGIQEHEEVILAVGRLVKRKAFTTLLESSEYLRDRENLKIVIVGDGPERGEIEQLSEHLKHPVQIVTEATDADVDEWYAAGDVFCLPVREVKNDVEGFGIVFLEAALHGLPVVAGKSGGIEEAVLDGKTGLLVAPDDPKALAESLRRLLSDPELRRKMGEAGRERVLKDFQWNERWKKFSEAMNG